MDFLKNALKNTVQKGKFKLTSGRESDFYINVKSLMFEAKLINVLGHIMFSTINKKWGNKIDAVGGMELGSVPLSTAISYRSYTYSVNKSVDHFVVRKTERKHGTGNLIEGSFFNKNVVIVDDVLTSGSSICKAYNELDKYCNILGAIVVVDRQEVDLSTLPLEVLSLYKKEELLED